MAKVLQAQAGWSVAALCLGLGLLSMPRAAAELEVCNESDMRASIAIGYRGDDVWTSEGWWIVAPGDCRTLIEAELDRRFYYWRATHAGGDWSTSRYMFCTDVPPFTIEGDADCEVRGYARKAFNRVALTEGTTGFRLRLPPPPAPASPEVSVSPQGAAEGPAALEAKMASAEATETATPAVDPPGTYGEPYSIAGVFASCDVADVTMECVLHADGFRYVARSVGPTPVAFFDAMIDMPSGTPLAWTGDMIGYEGATADVTIRSLEPGPPDPFAETRAALFGYWISRTDAEYAIHIEAGNFTEFSEGLPGPELFYTLAETCEGAQADGTYLIARDAFDHEEPRCFEIWESGRTRLSLFPPGTMQPLEFDRGD